MKWKQWDRQVNPSSRSRYCMAPWVLPTIWGGNLAKRANDKPSEEGGDTVTATLALGVAAQLWAE